VAGTLQRQVYRGLAESAVLFRPFNFGTNLDEFNINVDEISDTLKEYLEDLLFDVEGIKPAKISVRMAHE
jgi:hypothetical protein